jgi:hypothetical protein
VRWIRIDKGNSRAYSCGKAVKSDEVFDDAHRTGTGNH